MIALLIIIGIFIVIGMVFALPAYLPPLRRRARQASAFRSALIATLGLITFFSFFLSLTYIGAEITKSFAFIAFCADITEDCTMPTNPFYNDPVRDQLLTRELWLQNMIPPYFVSDTACFTGDEIVCEKVWDLGRVTSMNDVPDAEYILFILILLVPAISCGFVVRYITRDDRKQKQK